MAHDVFISHSAKDKATADAMCALLEASGIRCWVAPRDIAPGSSWAGAIVDAIGASLALVLVLSPNSNDSKQVMREVSAAADSDIPILPFKIHQVALSKELDFFIGPAHWLDAMTPPLEAHLLRLRDRLRLLLVKPRAPVGTQTPSPDAPARPASPAASSTRPRRAASWIAVILLVAGGIGATLHWGASHREDLGLRAKNPRGGEPTPARDPRASEATGLDAMDASAVPVVPPHPSPASNPNGPGLPAPPAWARVSERQLEEARRQNVPVAFENALGMRFVLIPAGDFMMGSLSNEDGREPDETAHRVEITQPFYASIWETTNGQYRRFKASHRSGSEFDADDQPVNSITYDEAVAFASWVSSTRDAAHHYRLPTEAEWEYACRAGTEGPFCFGADIDTDHANYRGTWYYNEKPPPGARNRTVRVGTLPPSPWGLYEVHGNVAEWCADYYSEAYYGSSRRRDPAGPAVGNVRALRGGAWGSCGANLRSAYRYTPASRVPIDPGRGGDGLRLVATVPSQR